MKQQLVILTATADDLARKIALIQQQDQSVNVLTVDLTTPHADYAQLVREIFGSDSVHVW